MTKNHKVIFIFLVGLLAFAANLCAQPEFSDDKTLSPYFFVQSNDPETDRLPLKSTSVDIHIAGVIADVTVTQVYENKGRTPLEAIYVFPASTRAAVYGMKMTIGERTIVAEIKQRDQARKAYEQARQEGKSASLLEQHRPNVFQMNVANILPGDVITVELKYTELLVPLNKVYEFVYPTVVGPRYTEKTTAAASSHDRWTENPYLHQGELPSTTLSIHVSLNAGLPIKDVACSSHPAHVDYKRPDRAEIRLKESEKHRGNKDFILRYRLAGNKIESGLLLFDGKKENHFLLMLQPPKRVKTSEIPPREYVFIVDVSGSMNGFPLDISKKLLRNLIGNLRPSDRFNVLLFAGGSSLMAGRSIAATRQNINQAIRFIDRQRGGGGTRLLPALERALSLEGTENTSRSIVIATDGYVAVEEQAFDLIRSRLGDANMFTFGIGSSVNRHLIEGMARVGMGEPFVITKPDEADKIAENFRKLIQTPVLTNIDVDYGRFNVYDVEPVSIPDVLAERPIIVFGKYHGTPKGTITVSGNTGRGGFLKKIDVRESVPSPGNAALRYLWARNRIAILSDYNRLNPKDERVREVTNLGLSYNLLTAYTSFVAIDSMKRLQHGKAVTVKQPLPLPEGVSDAAVGNLRYMMKSQTPMSSPGLSFDRKAPVERESFEEVKSDKSKVRKPKMVIDSISVGRGLSQKSARKLIDSRLESITTCYYNAAGGTAPEKLELSMVMDIGSNGKVKSLKIVNSSKKTLALEQCVVRQLKQLVFQPPGKMKPTQIKVTLIGR